LVYGHPDLAAGLDLANADCVLAEVLTAHPHHVGPPLSRVEQQCEGEPRARTDWVTALELLDLALGPRMIALALAGRDLAHVARGIIGAQPDLNGVLHQG